jgi:NADPH-dependent glutamate synthase beta subunit-like oxidoreductase
MPYRPADFTPSVDLTSHLGVGPVRSHRPVYVDLLAPCNNACPAGEDIQGWLALAQAGKYRPAWEALMADSPFPAVLGRVCYHPCENGCNRGHLDAPVSIHAVERFLGDLASAQGWQVPVAPATGKRVLVVGAGPGGLAAAYHLARLGHAVEVHEAAAQPGGMLHFGIPAYRLPRAELMKEIHRIEQMGVRIVLDHKVDDLLAEQHEGRFDAVFVAVGAQPTQHAEIPARDAARVLDAVTFLHEAGTGVAPRLGRRVVVYGGDHLATEAARTAMRLGAEETVIVYGRDRGHMTARKFETDDAAAEGVTFKWLSSIKEIVGSEVTIERMELGADGQPKPTGEFETLQADVVVLAIGQHTDSSFLGKVPGIAFKPDGTVSVGPNAMTGHAGIFAGGDMLPAGRTATAAIGQGRRAARHIDAWLRGAVHVEPPKAALVGYKKLNLPLFSEVDPTPQQALEVAARIEGFAEVLAGLSELEARREAERCLSCGNCYECDNCYAACPEEAIIKLGPGRRYRYDYTKCTGCAACFEQCPCHAIEMIPETVESPAAA